MAVMSAPTPPMAAASDRFRIGRRCSQMTSAPTATNTVTIRWLMTVAASSTAGSPKPVRSSSARARAPRKNRPRPMAMQNENSPASVLARLPPQIV